MQESAGNEKATTTVALDDEQRPPEQWNDSIPMGIYQMFNAINAASMAEEDSETSDDAKYEYDEGYDERILARWQKYYEEEDSKPAAK